MKFYKKYKYFFDRNVENENKEEKPRVITAIKAASIVIAIACFFSFENSFMIKCGLLFAVIAGITILLDKKRKLNNLFLCIVKRYRIC